MNFNAEVAEKNLKVNSREYNMASTKGEVFSFTGRIYSTINFEKDRLNISVSPKRLNKVPVILYEDIISVKISRKINFQYWVLIICGVILSLIGISANEEKTIFVIGVTILLVLSGLESKITIFQRNGNNVSIYSKRKSVAEEFKSDLESVANIK